MSSPPTNNQSTRLTSDRRRLSNNEISPTNNSLNPRRIQTGLPGIRRTVYDGALRVNSDAYDVLSGTVHDVHANVVVAAVNTDDIVDTNNGNDMALLQAKPEWRKHFPLNALLRPTTNSSAHDEFNIPATNTKKRRTTRAAVLVTELTNATVVTHQPRIVNEATGERAMCAVESVVTKGRNLEVPVLDLMEGEEELLGENGQEGHEEKEVLSIRGGGDGNEDDNDDDVVMEKEGAVEKKHDDVVDVNMAEAPVNNAAAAAAAEERGAVDSTDIASTATGAAAAAVDTATSTAIASSAGGESDAVVEAKKPVEAVASVPSAQGGVDEMKEVATQQPQPATTGTVADPATAAAAADTAMADDKSQVAPSVNAVGEQDGGVADVPTSSSPTAQVDTTTAAVSAPAVASNSATTSSTNQPPAAAAATAPTPEVTTVQSTTIHPLPSNHPPLSTSILPTTTTIITPPQNAPSWYHSTTISTTEKSSLPEWFNSSAPHRTPTTYLSTRNQILNIYQAQLSSSNTTAADTATANSTVPHSQQYLTVSAIRRCVPGDVGSLLRLHSFLCDWGLINGKDFGENAPSDLALRGGSASNVVGGKRKMEDAKRSVFWSKERLEQLDGVVVKHVKVTQATVGGGGVEGQQQQQQQPSVDWDAVAKDIGEGVSAADCQRAFLDPPPTDEFRAKIAKTSSSGFDLSTILDGVHPD
eukprot:scaffold9210_cov80-Skeletonema_menzelii.AAC.10